MIKQIIGKLIVLNLHNFLKKRSTFKFNPKDSKVDDQYVGIIVINNAITQKVTGTLWCSRNDREQNQDNLNNLTKNGSEKILLINLESPHIEEFESNTLPPSPALGSTGTNLKDLIINLNCFINNGGAIPNGTYKILLSNAIQFQASLGYCTEIFRDRCWLMMWIDQGRLDFIKRIQQYQPDVILNACTNGSHKCDPFFKSSNINISYLKNIDSNITQGPRAMLNDGHNVVIYDDKFLTATPNSPKYKHYLLRGFVMTAIEEAFKDNPPLYLYSPHPSSAHFKNKKGLKNPIRTTFF